MTQNQIWTIHIFKQLKIRQIKLKCGYKVKNNKIMALKKVIF